MPSTRTAPSTSSDAVATDPDTRHPVDVTALDAAARDTPRAGATVGAASKFRSRPAMRGRPDPTDADVLALWRTESGASAVRFGDVAQIYRILQDHGITQRAIARRTQQAQSEISEILAGRQVRDVAVIHRIADGLLLPRDEFTRTLQQRAAKSTQRPPTPNKVCPPAPASWAVCRRCGCPGPTEATAGPGPSLIGPVEWNGVHVKALRISRDMTLRGLAKHLGVSERAVTRWDAAGPDITPDPASQLALDTSLRTADPDTRTMFYQLLQHWRRHAARAPEASAVEEQS